MVEDRAIREIIGFNELKSFCFRGCFARIADARSANLMNEPALVNRYGGWGAIVPHIGTAEQSRTNTRQKIMTPENNHPKAIRMIERRRHRQSDLVGRFYCTGFFEDG